MAIPPIVEILWTDAAKQGGWRSREDYREQATVEECRSSGYLNKMTPTEVQVLQSIGPHDDGADSITIPRAWVRKIVTLRKGRPNAKE